MGSYMYSLAQKCINTNWLATHSFSREFTVFTCPAQLLRAGATDKTIQGAQAALINVRRHSKANKVVIALDFTEETIKMTIQDNGKGFAFQDISKLSKQGKLGMIGIQERVRLLGGILKVDSKRGKGTSISVEFRDQPSVITSLG